LVDGWQLAPQQEAHAVSQPIYGVHLGKTRRSLLRQGDGRQAPPGILTPVLRTTKRQGDGMDRSGPTGRPQADQTRLENDAVAAYGPDAEARPETDPETQMHDPGMVVESRLPLDSAPAGHDPKLAPGAR